MNQSSESEKKSLAVVRAEEEAARLRAIEEAEKERAREKEEAGEKKKLTKEDLQEELRTRSDNINRRIDAIQGEVMNVGESLKDRLFRHPLVSVGGALVLGVGVGLVFGGRKDRLGASHAALIDDYVDAVVEEARYEMGRGKEPGEAMRRALADRSPVVIYAPDESVSQAGLLGRTFGLVFNTVLAFGVRAAVDYFAARLAIEDVAEATQQGEL